MSYVVPWDIPMSCRDCPLLGAAGDDECPFISLAVYAFSWTNTQRHPDCPLVDANEYVSNVMDRELQELSEHGYI